MIPLLTLLAHTSTKPGDLVRFLANRDGHAFVAVPARQLKVDWLKSHRNSVEISNFALRTWGIIVPNRGGFATAESIEAESLLARRILYKRARAKPYYGGDKFSGLYGRRATVGEILAAGQVDPSRCHWSFMNRQILARFEPSSLENCLPDLARSVGGRYDEKLRRIEFEPTSFRKLALSSISNGIYLSDERYILSSGLFRIGIAHIKDSDLTSLFRNPNGRMIIEHPSYSEEESQCVRRYVKSALHTILINDSRNIDLLNEKVDLSTEPNLEIRADGTGGVVFIGRNGTTKIFF